jgi:hypothetical protein
MISSTAPRAAVILWPSAIVVLLRQFLAEPTIMKPAVADPQPDPARLLHHFYRLDPAVVRADAELARSTDEGERVRAREPCQFGTSHP